MVEPILSPSALQGRHRSRQHRELRRRSQLRWRVQGHEYLEDAVDVGVGRRRPCAACQRAAMSGCVSSVLMWSRFGMPIGPRASSIVIGTPKFGEHLDEHAHRRQRAVIDHGACPIENDRLEMLHMGVS